MALDHSRWTRKLSVETVTIRDVKTARHSASSQRPGSQQLAPTQISIPFGGGMAPSISASWNNETERLGQRPGSYVGHRVVFVSPTRNSTGVPSVN